MTFISRGRVKVYRVSQDGKQQTIVLLGPGDAFGEIGIVDLRAQELYVEALEETSVCRTERDAFLQLVSRDPALPIRFAEAMGEKLQEAREQIADFVFRDIRGRVAHLILTFLERARRLTGSDRLDGIVPGLTQRELADIIGTHRESVPLALNRTVGQPRTDGGLALAPGLSPSERIRELIESLEPSALEAVVELGEGC